MGIAYLLLGGNQGDPIQVLSKAKKLVSERIGKIDSESSFYKTQPWGFESELAFINQAILVRTKSKAEAVLSEIKLIEAKLGRIKTNERYSDRIIDIDILLLDDEVIDGKDLTIPHPQMHLRRFVLVPLSEIAGSIVHPVFGKTINTLRQDCQDGLEVTAIKVEA